MYPKHLAKTKTWGSEDVVVGLCARSLCPYPGSAKCTKARQEGDGKKSVINLASQDRIANRTIPTIAGLESREIPEREAKNESNRSKVGSRKNRFRIAIRIASL